MLRPIPSGPSGAPNHRTAADCLQRRSVLRECIRAIRDETPPPGPVLSPPGITDDPVQAGPTAFSLPANAGTSVSISLESLHDSSEADTALSGLGPLATRPHTVEYAEDLPRETGRQSADRIDRNRHVVD